MCGALRAGAGLYHKIALGLSSSSLAVFDQAKKRSFRLRIGLSRK
jgi:hypothetical protein